MTKRDPKDKLQIPTRKAGPKESGMFQNLRRPEQIESLTLEEIAGPAPSGGQTPSGGQGDRPPLSPSAQPTAAPARDFNRRANSLDRDALPAGLFPGTSKKLYDALYLRTRGAIKPRRTIQATKRDLAEWSGLRNRKTLDAHMRYFQMCGLITRQWEPGQNEGYTFEVFLPEERGLVDRPPQGDRPLEASDPNLVRGTDQILGSGGQTQTVDFQRTSETPKTVKTRLENPDDDEAAPLRLAFFELFERASKDITGQGIRSNESAKWAELADVLITELRIAAGRTTVSSVPAFLAEHLRRRLWKREKRELEAEAAQSAKRPSEADSERLKAIAEGCQYCFGTGMRYRGPGQFEGPVMRCDHQPLQPDGA
jgi:hypothetical protein